MRITNKLMNDNAVYYMEENLQKLYDQIGRASCRERV